MVNIFLLDISNNVLINWGYLASAIVFALSFTSLPKVANANMSSGYTVTYYDLSIAGFRCVNAQSIVDGSYIAIGY